jgi:hypothetical protein
MGRTSRDARWKSDEKRSAGEGGAGMVAKRADDGLVAMGQPAVTDGAQQEREPGRTETETNEIGAGTNRRERTVKNAMYFIPRTDPNA